MKNNFKDYANEFTITKEEYKDILEKLESLSSNQIRIEQKITEAHTRLSKIEDSNKWICRTIIGSLILGLLSIVFGI